MSKINTDRIGTRDGTLDIDVKSIMVRSDAMENLGDYEQGLELTQQHQYIWKDESKYTVKLGHAPFVLTGVWEFDKEKLEIYGAWDHSALTNRDKEGSHPAGAITYEHGTVFPDNSLGKELQTLKNNSSDYQIVDSFEQGATITERNQALQVEADGRLYRWAGDLPKTVAAGSSPETTGGAQVGAWLEVSDLTLRQELANPNKGAEMVAYSGGSVADKLSTLATTPQMYGAKGDGIVDDTSAIRAWIAGSKLLINPSLLLPKGSYVISDTIEFDLPNGSNVQFDGAFFANTSGKVAVRLGQADQPQFYSRYSGLKVRRVNASGGYVSDTTDGTIGVEIRNLVEPIVDIRNVGGFREGVVVHGSHSNGGVSYAQVFLGRLVDNGKQLKLMTSGTGYVNENTFYGGRFAYSGSYPTRGDEVNIVVERTTEHTLNNNVFFRPSLEAVHATTKGFFIDGRYCSVIHPRCENPSDFSGFIFEFGPQSEFCDIVGVGFGVNISNIVDNGSANSYTFKQGTKMVRETANSPFRAVLTLKSTKSDAATAISVLNTNESVETIKLKQDGVIEATQRVYAQNGFRWRGSVSTKDDRGLFNGLGDPEGVQSASVGSMYIARNGSKGTSLYIKESGLGATGWIPYQGVYSGATAARPSGVGVGVQYFDTTLNKPIWYNGTSWVDATGAVV